MARDLLGMYLEHDTPEGRLAGYIVDAEAYLGPEDEAAHSYGLRRTPRVRAMYEKPGTIYLYTMHTHRILNIITQPEGIPQGVMIRAIEPAAMIDQMSKNRGGKTGPDISNGPGKLVEALAIPQELYGQSIADSSLRLVFEKKRHQKRSMLCLESVSQTKVYGQKSRCVLLCREILISLYKEKTKSRKIGVGGKKMKKKDLLTYLDEIIEKQVTDYDVALDWDTKNHTIEIVVRLFAENKAQFEIDDAEGIVSQEPIIEFEDGVLLFNPQKSVFDERNYLAVIPYEGKKGLAKSVADSLVEYLNEVLAQGQSDLLDFLDEDDDEAVFELHWDNQQLAELVEVKQQNEADTYLPYPSY